MDVPGGLRKEAKNDGYGGACYFGCLKGPLQSVQVLFSGIEAVVVVTLIILKQRALYSARVEASGLMQDTRR